MPNSRFRWKPLGGLGEVGMNAMVFFFGDLAVPVDAGISFADPNDFGIEALHVDYREILLAHRPPYWLITHSHEDHIGAVAAILDICRQESIDPPEILAPPLAGALIRERVNEERRYPGARSYMDKIRDVKTDSKIEHDGLVIRFLETRHSTLDTCSLAFEWSHGGERPLRVLHTADFKLDAHNYEDGRKTVGSVYGAFNGERADFLFIDSTNSEREGHSIAEADILPGLEKLIATAPGRVFVTLFSSNIQRIASLVAIGAKHGRYACLAGRSMQNAHKIAMDLGLYGTSCHEILLSHLKENSEISRMPHAKQLVVCSGSQGEYRSVLSKISQGTHAEFDVGGGDRIIFSSKLIPGNERPVGRLINGLLRRGSEVIYGENAKEIAGGPIHASGHARREEIAAVMEFLKPAHVIPVHGELRHLMSCAGIARARGPAWRLDPRNVHVVENGTELEFGARGDKWELVERRLPVDPVPRTLRFEDFVSPSRDPFLKVRKRAAQGGVVSVCIDSMGRSQVAVHGVFPEATYFGKFKENVESSLEGWAFAKFKQLTGKDFNREDGALRTELADDLARHFRRLTGIRPYTIVHLMGRLA